MAMLTDVIFGVIYTLIFAIAYVIGFFANGVPAEILGI